jgi:hypothetical protein
MILLILIAVVFNGSLRYNGRDRAKEKWLNHPVHGGWVDTEMLPGDLKRAESQQ